MPNLKLPYGNPALDFELGVIFYIFNSKGQTYVFNVNEKMASIGITFKVRKTHNSSFAMGSCLQPQIPKIASVGILISTKGRPAYC
jgi:hypothetical protein